jgi:mRNA interferase MazF
MEIKQYEVYWVNLDPTVGKEMKKTRPCVVLSPDEMNKFIGTVIIAPLTSTVRNYPSRVKYALQNKQSMIALDQIKTVDKVRLQKKISPLDKATILLVKRVLEDMLVK